MAFIGLDVYFPNISNVKTRKIVVVAELITSGQNTDELFYKINFFFFLRSFGFLMVYWLLLYG